MKKLILFITIFLCFQFPAYSKRERVELISCTDGDTAHFKINGKNEKVRFLGIDAPEYTNEIEPFGKEASEFVCEALTNASVLEIEYDKNAGKTDKFDRHLVWIFTDGILLNDEIVRNGLAEVTYLYDDYKYNDKLLKSQDYAKDKQLNIWGKNLSGDNSENNIIIYIIGIIAIGVVVFSGTKNKKMKVREIIYQMKKHN